MSPAVFQSLLPALSKAKTLILNGIGEPLLHPDLLDFIRAAQNIIPKGSIIGFQSNGLLFTPALAEKLLDAGLNTICFSVDDLTKSPQQAEYAHSFRSVQRAITIFNEARKNNPSRPTLGLEMVLTRSNYQQLPQLVSWADQNQVDYILTSHMLLYHSEAEKESLFNPNAFSNVRLFEEYSAKAKKQGISYEKSFKQYRRHAGTRSTPEESKLFSSMQEAAKKLEFTINYEELFKYQDIPAKRMTQVFKQAENLADQTEINLFIPPSQALDKRECLFMKEKAVFIAVNGEVMPCHYLWHTYNYHLHHQRAQVEKRVMGNLLSEQLMEIWQKPAYQQFRKEAEQVKYSPCWSCPSGPCQELINDTNYANDCYGSIVPCGHCQWSLGGFRCL